MAELTDASLTGLTQKVVNVDSKIMFGHDTVDEEGIINCRVSVHTILSVFHNLGLNYQMPYQTEVGFYSN